MVKSLIGTIESHRACARGLGLRRREHTVEVLDTPENRGMINKISLLVESGVLICFEYYSTY